MWCSFTHRSHISVCQRTFFFLLSCRLWWCMCVCFIMVFRSNVFSLLIRSFVTFLLKRIFLPRLFCYFIRTSFPVSWQTNILSNQAFYVYFCNWQLRQRDFNEQKQNEKMFFQVFRSLCGSFYRRRPLRMSLRSMCVISSTYVAIVNAKTLVWGSVCVCENYFM